MVTEQNNARQAQLQAHGKPNKLHRKQTHGFSKKKKKTPIQITEIRNLKSVVQYIRNH